MRQEIKDSFKDLMTTFIKNYIACFCIISVVITVLAAIKVGLTLWLMGFVLYVWLVGEVIVFTIPPAYMFLKKLIIKLKENRL